MSLLSGFMVEQTLGFYPPSHFLLSPFYFSSDPFPMVIIVKKEGERGDGFVFSLCYKITTPVFPWSENFILGDSSQSPTLKPWVQQGRTKPVFFFLTLFYLFIFLDSRLLLVIYLTDMKTCDVKLYVLIRLCVFISLCIYLYPCSIISVYLFI